MSYISASEARHIRGLAGTVVKADETRGEVTAFVNRTGVVDRQNDVMVPGCFSKVINEGQSVAIAWSHDITKIVGKVTQLEELMPGDPRIPYMKGSENTGGLLMKALFATATQAGKDAFELVKGGFVKQWSVQFSVADGGEEKDGVGTRFIKLVNELFEVSPVLVGASPATGTLSVKQAFARASELSPAARRENETAERVGIAAADRFIDSLNRERVKRVVVNRMIKDLSSKQDAENEKRLEQEKQMAELYRLNPYGFAQHAGIYHRLRAQGLV
ncbi:MAG: HK97 family phage prohead protease [Candidatus Dormibacteraeota bacterium]|nr:HK97 family phage prohead protease [Candidatus Dormibacteraeota bacterium]